MAANKFINLDEVEQLAKERMTKMAFDYYAGGAETGSALEANSAAFAAYRVVPRVLRDVSGVDTSSTLLGHKMAMPVLVAPMAMHGLADPVGRELATAAGAAAANVPMCVSTMATASISEVAAARPRPPLLFFQLYAIKDRGVVEQWVREAQAAGYAALMLTVDAPRLGKREADERNGFVLPEGLELKNLAPLAATRRTVEYIATGAADAAAAAAAAVLRAGEAERGSGLFKLFASYVDDRLTWDVLPWLRTITKMPVFVKGVLAPEDAVLALRHGAAGIVVSNHGGRQLDHAPAALDVLPAIVAAVRAAGSAAPVLVDGGVRRGTDVLKALALGADAVLVGRPLLYALAVDGAAGVARALKLLRDELELAMALAGATKVEELGPQMLLRARPALEPVAPLPKRPVSREH